MSTDKLYNDIKNLFNEFEENHSVFSEKGTKIHLEVRGKKHGGIVSELPFFKKSYVK